MLLNEQCCSLYIILFQQCRTASVLAKLKKKGLPFGQATPKIWLPEAISDLPISIQIMNGPQQKLTFIYLTLKENTHTLFMFKLTIQNQNYSKC